MNKRCPRCRKRKKVSDFNKDKSRKDGLFPWCRKCHGKSADRYRKNLGSEEVRKIQTAYRAKRDANTRARKKYLMYMQLYGIKRRYGISSEDVVALAEKQKGRCAICKRRPSKKSKFTRFHIDHCHKSRKVRGLLCGACNFGIGFFADDVQRLKAAIRYLKR